MKKKCWIVFEKCVIFGKSGGNASFSAAENCQSRDAEIWDADRILGTLRFLLQSGVEVIPKSTHKERMVENFDVFDFELSVEDMARLEEFDTAQSLFFSHCKIFFLRITRNRN